MRALIIGGTGPTGHFLCAGLLNRGFHVSIFHRGTHETETLPSSVEHIHGDPHFAETAESALRGKKFDLVIATYGRTRVLVHALKGKTERFIAITGAPVYRGYLNPAHNTPFGLPVPIREDAPVVDSPDVHPFSYKISETEKTLMASHDGRAFNVTCFRYPQVYGPYQPNPLEWCVIRRILDNRPHIILPDGGLSLESRGYAENVAHCVLLAVDHPKASAGEIYNVADDEQFTLRQWVEMITQAMSYRWEIVSVPEVIARPGWPLLPFQGPASHRLMDTQKVKLVLGYKDVVPVRLALEGTVQWYIEHRPEQGGETESRLQDPFDYAVEDEIVNLYNSCINQIESKVKFKLPSITHPYAHPKVEGKKRDHKNR